jgi:hypothetical protein
MSRAIITPLQIEELCSKAVALSPEAIGLLMAEFVGTKEAIALLQGRGDTFAELSAMLGKLSANNPAPFSLCYGLDMAVGPDRAFRTRVEDGRIREITEISA